MVILFDMLGIIILLMVVVGLIYEIWSEINADKDILSLGLTAGCFNIVAGVGIKRANKRCVDYW